MVVRRASCLALCLLPLLLSCGWMLNEKHEEVWRFEWKFVTAAGSAPVRDSSLRYELLVPLSYTRSFRGSLDSGWLFQVVYSEPREDFLARNPTARAVVCRAAGDTVLDSTLSWNQCGFRDQVADVANSDRIVFRNVSKKTFPIRP